MTDIQPEPIKALVDLFLQELMKSYWGPLYQYLVNNPELIKTVPAFLLRHEELAIYIGRKHIAIEYTGSEITTGLVANGVAHVTYRDYSTRDGNLLEQIVGFEPDSTISKDWSMPLPTVSEDLLVPTNRGWHKLIDLGWNFAAQNAVMAFNAPSIEPREGCFTRIINGMFFDADESGLKSRRIKWLDFFPIKFDGEDPEYDTFEISFDGVMGLVEHDAHYKFPMPDEYKYKQLPKINHFIEMWGDGNSTEPEITAFLARPENNFILTMKFGVPEIRSELTCHWQSEVRKSIRPDFFIVNPNGFADIVEFKLPHIDKSFIVGSDNREAFASWLSSYVAQTRVYVEYFDDPNNRKWFFAQYGFKVHKPRRYLVVGRRSDFESDIWREIMAEYVGLDILTFDDLVDGVVTQFYMA